MVITRCLFSLVTLISSAPGCVEGGGRTPGGGQFHQFLVTSICFSPQDCRTFDIRANKDREALLVIDNRYHLSVYLKIGPTTYSQSIRQDLPPVVDGASEVYFLDGGNLYLHNVNTYGDLSYATLQLRTNNNGWAHIYLELYRGKKDG
jgi:hypothetical protein